MIGIVFRKELVDHRRDKRTVAMAFFLPLLGPLVAFFALNAFADWLNDDKPVKIGIVGEERAPNLAGFLRRTGVELTAAPPTYRELVKSGALDGVVVVDERYAEKFEKAEPAHVELYVDNSRQEGRGRARRARAALDAYAGQIAGGRLLVRGVSPELAHPLDTEEIEVATSQQLAATFLNMIPMFLLMVVVVGGMHLAIDSTAGERERKSLEPLLVNPVPRGSIVLGKWLASSLVTAVYLLFAIAGFAIMLEKAPLAALGAKVSFGGASAITILLAVLPLALLATSIQICLSLFAKTFKEAQLYVTLLTMVAIVPGMALAFHPMDASTKLMFVPALSQALLLSSALRGDPIEPLWLVIAGAVVLVIAALVLRAATRLLSSERIVFGR